MQSSKRVFLGSIATETNTFSPLRTDIQDFKESFYAPPGGHPKTPTLCLILMIGGWMKTA